MDADWVKRRLKERGFSIADFGRAISRERAVASKIIHGQVKFLPSHAAPLARLLGMSPTEVLKMAGLDLPPAIAVPMISWVAASQFAEVAEGIDFSSEYPRIHVDYSRPTLFALEVVGDSMDRVAPEGSIIVVDYLEKELSDRDLAVFSRDGETTFKRFRADAKGVWLEPESFNARHAPILPAGDTEIEVVGRVVAVPRLLRPGP